MAAALTRHLGVTAETPLQQEQAATAPAGDEPIAIIGIGFLMMTQVVPTLAQTFAEVDAELPRATQLVIDVSNFLVNYTWWALAIVVMEKVATASIGAITVTAQAKLAEAKAKERAP